MKRKLYAHERGLCLVGPAYRINFALMARIRGSLAAGQLQGALERVRPRHPLLAMRFDLLSEGGPYAVSDGVPPFPVRELDSPGEAGWLRVVEEELARPFPVETGPFARFILLRSEGSAELVAVFDHGICDGFSGIYLLRDILRLLADPDLDLPPLQPSPPMNELFPPDIIRSLPVRIRLGLASASLPLVRRSARQAARSARASAEAAIAPAEGAQTHAPPLSRRFHVLAGSLSADQTADLVRRCRVEGTSVTAALCTAWLLAWRDMRGATGSHVRRATLPVNLRDRLTQPVAETAGNYFGQVDLRVDCAPGRPFWDVARDVKRELTRVTTGWRPFMSRLQQYALAMLPLAEVEGMISLVDSPLKDFSVTNLGRLDLDLEYGPLALTALWAPIVCALANERQVGACTAGGVLYTYYAFRESRMDLATGQELMDRAMGRLVESL